METRINNSNRTATLGDFFSYQAKLDGMQAIPAIGGKLIKVNDCILFEDQDGTIATPLFPYQLTNYDKPNNRIIIAGKSIEFGQTFSTAGFIVDKNSKTQYITKGLDSCLKDKVVFLGAGVSIVK